MLANYLCQDRILKYEIIDVAQSKNKARQCSGEKVIVEGGPEIHEVNRVFTSLPFSGAVKGLGVTTDICKCFQGFVCVFFFLFVYFVLFYFYFILIIFRCLFAFS